MQIKLGTRIENIWKKFVFLEDVKKTWVLINDIASLVNSTKKQKYQQWTFKELPLPASSINSCFTFQLFVSFPCLPCSALPVVLFLSSSFASSILPPPSSPSSKRGGTAKCPERVGFGSSKQSWLSSFPPEYLRYWDQATDCPTPCIGRCHHIRQHCRLTICIELVELTNSVSIRWQDPNNNTDTEARCLV